jgi:hypothetical protein
MDAGDFSAGMLIVMFSAHDNEVADPQVARSLAGLDGHSEFSLQIDHPFATEFWPTQDSIDPCRTWLVPWWPWLTNNCAFFNKPLCFLVILYSQQHFFLS